MSLHGFNVRNFISNIGKYGVAYPNRYEIQFGAYGNTSQFVFDREMLTLLNARLQKVSFPSATIGSKGQLLLGIEREMPYGRIYEGDIKLEFIETKDYKIRKAFTDWQSKVIDPDHYSHGYYDEYISTLIVKAFGKEKETTEVSFDVPSLNREGPIRPTALAAGVAIGEQVANALFRRKPKNFVEVPKPPIKAPEEIKIPVNAPADYAVKIEDVFPKSIESIDLSAASEDLVKTEISLSFRRWEEIFQ